jgi:hypothetical protein
MTNVVYKIVYEFLVKKYLLYGLRFIVDWTRCPKYVDKYINLLQISL